MKSRLFSCLGLLTLCLATPAAHAQVFVEGSALYSRFDGDGFGPKKHGLGFALDSGWRFGADSRHAVKLGLQSTRWSDAHPATYASVYGSGYSTRNLRTRLEAVTIGYEFRGKLASAWQGWVSPAAGWGRLQNEVETQTFYAYDPSLNRTSRQTAREDPQLCLQLHAGLRWQFSPRGHVRIAAGYFTKTRDGDASLPFGRLGALQLAAGLGLTF